ncbi:MAG TPA: N-6 DNA methylase, partial [Chitinophagales bacterium]|nr:N-6 DNA methylase [Chitinophagales bacterium]
MTIHEYITNLNKRYQLGNATEHTFRGDLQHLIETIVKDVSATNEPKRIACGAPDYIIMRKDVPVGYIEAKDIGDKDLRGAKTNNQQFDRYKASLSNLIFTDYIDFHFYKDGIFVTKIAIAEISNNAIVAKPENFDTFTNLLINFALTISQTIKSPTRLAEMMAGKARLMADVIEKSLNEDDEKQITSSLKAQMQAFKDLLIHDIDNKAFSDIYAQTIAYGMFAARYHDPTLPTFSRQEAATLIPKSNPFLRKLFQDIAGYDLDERLLWMVEELVAVFLASDVADIMRNFGKSTKQEDPVIHFYETFLAAYNPALRKARGVWYTPQPVVNFIVRAVDDILKTEFNLKEGLADTAKTKIKIDLQGKKVEQEVHKVQILDPATGTGTFLAEVVKHIYKKFEGQQGIWNSYVEQHLIPRLNGFELLMASYAMAHLKMDMLLTETGFKATQEQRTRIFLTNSLEESHPDAGTLFASWLSDEANQANKIKRDAPVMCVIGNPPYSGESNNKGEWIMNLMEDYKKEPGGKEKLNERNPKWINDDYVKFIRFGQYFIDKNGEGVLAFINPHGYLDNPTFRGMRWNLLKSFDKIYTIDLHGNSKKKETAPDGSADVNVFDIMQGVSINFFIKTGKKKTNELARVFHFDLFGKREFKYDYLIKNSLKTIDYKELPNVAPNYFFVKKDFDQQKIYNKGFSISELFPLNNVGIVTARDSFTIHNSKEGLQKTIEEFLSLDDEIARKKFDLGKDVRDWQVNFAKKDLQNYYPNKGKFVKINYRPFDEKWTFYTGKTKGFHCYPRNEVMQHFLKGENIGLVFKLGNAEENSVSTMVTKNIIDFRSWSRPGMQGGDYVAPLYLYPETTTQTSTEATPARTPNLNLAIVHKIAEKIGLQFVAEPHREQSEAIFRFSAESLAEDSASHNAVSLSGDTAGKNGDTAGKRGVWKVFSPIDILDYIYAVLHSPTYREKYKEFLKIDFPRVPYPKDVQTFNHLVGLGAQLRQLHLLESDVTEKYITQYPVSGSNHLVGVNLRGGNVYINDTQYFANVPLVAWNFYIGGYQPAQKWLKDRKDRTLTFEDILHYQKIIVALTETD